MRICNPDLQWIRQKVPDVTVSGSRTLAAGIPQLIGEQVGITGKSGHTANLIKGKRLHNDVSL